MLIYKDECTLPVFFQKEVSYKLSKNTYIFDILGFFDEIFLMKVLVFQNFDQKVPKIEQKTEVCYKFNLNFYLE